jgi:type IV secretion system protein VirD4
MSAMSATKILWGQIAVVFLIVLLTIWGATQWTAWRLGFQPELGRPWFELAGMPVYYPPVFFWWWYVFDAYAPQVFVEGAFMAASGGFISIAAAIGMSVWRAREAKNVETYGSARWADLRGVKAAGLLGADGVVLGQLGHEYLRHDGPEHVLCFAPTRSGKGVGLVVPSLLTWPGSAIVHDIKGENWQLTAGYRSQHGRVLLFDPTNAKSCTIRCWKSAAATGRYETSRTSPTCWSTRRDRSTSGTIGRRPAIHCSSARSCMSSTPRWTKHWPASPRSSRIRSGRSRQRYRR